MAVKKSKVFQYFEGKFISITVKDVKTRTGNMSFVGFLIDEDAEHYYLTDELDGAVEAAIPKNQCAGMTTLNANDLMDSIIVPEDQGVQ